MDVSIHIWMIGMTNLNCWLKTTHEYHSKPYDEITDNLGLPKNSLLRDEVFWLHLTVELAEKAKILRDETNWSTFVDDHIAQFGRP